MTKEDILQKHFMIEFGHDGHGEFMQYILNAMEEYAQQEVRNLNSITCGERDENGICDTYVNGKKTNVRMLVWTKEEIEKLHEIVNEIDKKKDRWKCMLCGRDKFTHKSPHKCVGGYRKRKIVWQGQ